MSNRKGSAISHVLEPVARALDIDIFYYPYEDMDDMRDYDLVHIGYIGLAEDKGFLHEIATVTANVWNISVAKTPIWASTNFMAEWDHFIVDDTTTYQTLGQLGASNITLIPLAFEHSHFKPLPTPDSEFTVGVFCNNYPSKRYHVVYEACELAGVRCFCQVLDCNRTHYSLNPIEDVYKHIHVLAHASYTDTNSMPVQEALLCGRPVLSTHNFGVHRVLRDGLNGYFYGGSAGELAEKILMAKERYEELREGVLHHTPKPPLEEAINGYRDLFGRLLGGEELPLVQRAFDKAATGV
jgi:hypothetical protein